MREPYISVIMSVYNSEKYLSESIESILNQTFSDFEFIIIDDGSIDNSLDIIEMYSKKDSRIQIIRNEINIGLTKSLNKGITFAKGKYIARMDADDISMPERFKTQLEFLEKNLNIYVVGTNIICVNEAGNYLYECNFPNSPNIIKWNLYFSNQLAHPSVMMRSDLFLICGYKYDESYRYAQDYELWQNISRNYQISNITKPLLIYRIMNSSISSSSNKIQKIFADKSLIKYLYQMTNIKLNNNQIEGLKISSQVKNWRDGAILCKLIIKLYLITTTWQLKIDEKQYISTNVEKKIITIWKACNMNISLTPFVLCVFVLSPKKTINRVLNKIRNKWKLRNQVLIKKD